MSTYKRDYITDCLVQVATFIGQLKKQEVEDMTEDLRLMSVGEFKAMMDEAYQNRVREQSSISSNSTKFIEFRDISRLRDASTSNKTVTYGNDNGNDNDNDPNLIKTPKLFPKSKCHLNSDECEKNVEKKTSN
jgi:hypothetical protein